MPLEEITVITKYLDRGLDAGLKGLQKTITKTQSYTQGMTMATEMQARIFDIVANRTANLKKAFLDEQYQIAATTKTQYGFISQLENIERITGHSITIGKTRTRTLQDLRKMLSGVKDATLANVQTDLSGIKTKEGWVNVVYDAFQGIKNEIRAKAELQGYSEDEIGAMTAHWDLSKKEIESWGDIADIKNKVFTVTEKMTKGMVRFRMELLSIMFFGAMLQKTMFGLLKPALEITGVFDLLSTILMILFLPIAIWILKNIMIPMVKWIGSWSEETKTLVGWIVLILGIIGAGLFIYATLGLAFIGLATATKGWGLAMLFAKLKLASLGTVLPILAIFVIAAILIWRAFRKDILAILDDLWKGIHYTMEGEGEKAEFYWGDLWNRIGLLSTKIIMGMALPLVWLAYQVHVVLTKLRNTVGTYLGWTEERVFTWQEWMEAAYKPMVTFIRETETSLDAQKKAYESAGASVDEMKNEINNIVNTYQTSSNITDANTEAVNTNIESMDDWKATFESMKTPMNVTQGDISKVTDNLITSGTEWENYGDLSLANLDDMSIGVGDFKTDFGDMTTSFEVDSSTQIQNLKDTKKAIEDNTTAVKIYTQRLQEIPTEIRTTIYREEHVSVFQYVFKKLFGGWFQRGGIFTKPTIIGVGEAGPEAVTPLGRGKAGATVVYNDYRTINMTNEIRDEVDAEIIKRKISEDIVREINAILRR